MTADEESDLVASRAWIAERRKRESATCRSFDSAWLPEDMNPPGAPPTPRADRLDSVEFTTQRKVIAVCAFPDMCMTPTPPPARSRSRSKMGRNKPRDILVTVQEEAHTSGSGPAAHAASIHQVSDPRGPGTPPQGPALGALAMICHLAAQRPAPTRDMPLATLDPQRQTSAPRQSA